MHKYHHGDICRFDKKHRENICDLVWLNAIECDFFIFYNVECKKSKNACKGSRMRLPLFPFKHQCYSCIGWSGGSIKYLYLLRGGTVGIANGATKGKHYASPLFSWDRREMSSSHSSLVKLSINSISSSRLDSSIYFTFFPLWILIFANWICNINTFILYGLIVSPWE